MYYPLEKTCITVNEVPVQVVCNRIVDFMKTNSIHCHYRDTHVDCQTMGLVKFTIYLWKAPCNGGILVEIQRRDGCCIVMHHVRQGLAQAISTGQAPVLVCERATNPFTVNHTVSSLATVEHKSDSLGALRITLRLLQSEQYDENQLGMESLITLTNPNSVSIKDARLACRALVYGDAPVGDCLRKAVLRYFQDTIREKDHYTNIPMEHYDSDADDDEEEYAQGYHFGCMHNMALVVLGNALQVVAELDDDDSRTPTLDLVDVASPFWHTICNALVYNMEVANYRPREAALSAKCLNLLARLAPVICHCPMMLDRLAPVLPDANEYGKACSRLLENESHKLMGTLAEAS